MSNKPTRDALHEGEAIGEIITDIRPAPLKPDQPPPLLLKGRVQISTDEGTDILYGVEGPTERQRAFRDDPAQFKLYGGSVGGGKSFALCAEALRLSLGFAGNRGFMCRHESTAFKITTLVTLLKLIDEVSKLCGKKIMLPNGHHKTDKTITFINGSQIMYGSLGDTEDFDRIKSLEIGWFAIDEASETQFENFQMLKSRLRWKLPSATGKGKHPPYVGLLASNPEPGWVKDSFVTPQQLGEPLPGYSFIRALPKDNQHLPREYVNMLRTGNTPGWVKRYLDGSWDVFEGQVWPDYQFEIHAINDFEIPVEWKRFRAIDHGQVHPTCCLWFAIDPDGNLFIYREYYKSGVVSVHCKAINTLSGTESYTATYLPPECWGKTREKEGKLWSINDEYWEHKISCIKANNDVLTGINRVGEYFKINPDRVHPLTGEKGSPSLFIFKNCKNLLLEIPEYGWKDQKGAEKAKEAPKKIRDDAVDAMRYGVMSRPSPTKLEQTLTPYGSFKWHLRQLTEKKFYDGMLRRM